MIMRPEVFGAKVSAFLSAQIDSGARLRMVKMDDAAFILRARTATRLADRLSFTPPSQTAQREWLEHYFERSRQGLEHYFIIESAGVAVGTVRMYDYRLEEGSFCWGSWIVEPGAHPSCGIKAAIQVYDIGFRELGFSLARFDVRKSNKGVLAFHRRVGASEVSQDELNIYFSVSASAYENSVRPNLLRLHGKIP